MKKIIFFIITISIYFVFSSVFAYDYENHWAEPHIKSAIENKLAFGTSENNFEPDRNINRAEFISLLVNYANIKSDLAFTSFNDIDKDAWYFGAIAAAEEQNIVKGYNDGGFHPNEALTRQDAVAFICRAYNIDPPQIDAFIQFSDYNEISDYAKKYFLFALNNKIIVGYENNTIKPKNQITRAEAIVILDKFSELSKTFEKTPQFCDGYPKISSKGSMNNITVEIKTTAPCTIYYKAVKKNTSSSYLTPKKEEITDFLALVSAKETVVTSNIVLNSYNEEYNVFFMAVADHGTRSNIQRIKDVKALAYSEGDGSEENPYIIYDENQLDYIRYCQDKHFKLACDIKLSREWKPIDASDGYFGSLDGDGHTISGMIINNNNQNVGFFSEIKGGVIKNLSVEGDVQGKNNVGIFAGKTDETIISNCVASGFVKASSNNAGGFLGINNGNIENSVSALYSVEAVANAGGFAGSSGGYISNSMSAVHSVLADMYAGGISGINNSGTIKNCFAASLNVVDFLTYNSGRITTNKESGTTQNNYGYSHMNTSSSNVVSGYDSIDGINISWGEMQLKSFYENSLGWDFKNNWKMTDNLKSNFILPIPKIFSDINLSKGLTPYAPFKITNSKELREINPEFHYILSNNINFNSDWSPMDEFNGSFDGNGFFIKGLKISYSDSLSSYNMFKTSTGIIRNLTLTDFSADGADSVSSITGSNYGVIENCKVKGTITASQAKTPVLAGGICSINYGTLENCESDCDFKVGGNSSTVGGIASHNEGFINNCAYTGRITINANGINSSTSAGGIAGFNNEGFIYETYANPQFEIKSYTNYTGGICGILNSGEIYKSSSRGKIKTSSANTSISTAYTGGICALSVSGLIFESFSALGINTESTVNYSGGIAGFNSAANIQSTYSLSTISQQGGSFMATEKIAFAGGIAGFSESGFISDNAAINPWILSNGSAKRITNCENPEFLNNNYAYDQMISSVSKQENDFQNGNPTDITTLKNPEFFFAPVYKSGKLGWSSTTYDGADATWQTPKTNNRIFNFPILNGVKYQNEFISPTEFK